MGRNTVNGTFNIQNGTEYDLEKASTTASDLERAADALRSYVAYRQALDRRDIVTLSSEDISILRHPSGLAQPIRPIENVAIKSLREIDETAQLVFPEAIPEIRREVERDALKEAIRSRMRRALKGHEVLEDLRSILDELENE